MICALTRLDIGMAHSLLSKPRRLVSSVPSTSFLLAGFKEERLVCASNTANPALKQFRSSPSAEDVKFTVKYFPYQLYPEASNQGEDKYEWYVILHCRLERSPHSNRNPGTRQQNTTTPKSR